MPLSIDYEFLSALEGGSKTGGYVPAASVSKSGVTIATGFDLGQRSEAELKGLRLDVALLKKLSLYCGIRGENAQALLKKTPLTITVSEAASIDKAVKASHIAQLQLKYDTAPNNKKRFSDLPAQAQTVIASVSFQYGTGLAGKVPRFWTAVTTQDWPEAIGLLKMFGDAYPTRRKKEAELLEKIK